MMVEHNKGGIAFGNTEALGKDVAADCYSTQSIRAHTAPNSIVLLY